MGLFDGFIKAKKRSLENLNITLSADNFLHILGHGDKTAAFAVTLNVEAALGAMIYGSLIML